MQTEHMSITFLSVCGYVDTSEESILDHFDDLSKFESPDLLPNEERTIRPGKSDGINIMFSQESFSQPEVGEYSAFELDTDNESELHAHVYALEEDIEELVQLQEKALNIIESEIEIRYMHIFFESDLSLENLGMKTKISDGVTMTGIRMAMDNFSLSTMSADDGFRATAEMSESSKISDLEQTVMSNINMVDETLAEVANER